MGTEAQSLTIRPVSELADFKRMAKFTDNWDVSQFEALKENAHSFDLIEDMNHTLLGWAVSENSGKHKIVIGMEWLPESDSTRYTHAQYGGYIYTSSKTPAQFLLDHMLAQMEVTGQTTLDFTDIISGRDEIKKLLEPYKNDPRIFYEEVTPSAYFADPTSLDAMVSRVLDKLEEETGFAWHIYKMRPGPLTDKGRWEEVPVSELPRYKDAKDLYFRSDIEVERPLHAYRTMKRHLKIKTVEYREETAISGHAFMPVNWVGELVKDSLLDADLIFKPSKNEHGKNGSQSPER